MTTLTSTVGITGICASPVEDYRPSMPNIVFILADDLGIGDLGCYGQERIKTPVIDSLASRGLKFIHHYSGSTVSAPSRCALMTGKDTGHCYIRGNLGLDGFDVPLRTCDLTVAEILKSKGYATACVGKWGLGGPGTTGSPVNRGYDYFCGYLSQAAAHRYYPEYLYENEEKLMLYGEKYSHFVIMDKGLDFIRRNADRPFFVYFAITPPHADLDYPDIRAYEGAFEEPIERGNIGNFKYNPSPRATYASMVSEIDRSVGRIINELKEQGVLDSTIVIFASDNGVHNVGGHDPDYFRSHGIFRGFKRDLYEGGVRVPLVINWNTVITQPRDVSHISAFWDFLPTVCDIIGVQKPNDIQGISYLPTILGDDQSQKEHPFIYFEFYERGGAQSILKDGWKLIRLNMDHPDMIVEELYNLDEDISETHNVIEENRGIADALRALAESHRSESDLFGWGRE